MNVSISRFQGSIDLQGNSPNSEQFLSFCEQGCNRIAMWETIDVDFCSPLSLFHSVACSYEPIEGFKALPRTFLFEANDDGAITNKLSIIGFDSDVNLQIKDDKVEVFRNGKWDERGHEPNPLDWLQAFCDRIKPCSNSYALSISCGLYGYLGYDMVRFIEPSLQGQANTDIMEIPDSNWMLPSSLVVYDGNSGLVSVIVFCDPTVGQDYDAGLKQIVQIKQKIHQSHEMTISDFLPPDNPMTSDQMVTTFPDEQEGYMRCVDEIKQLIKHGEAFQVVLGQVFSVPITCSSWMLYRSIRQTSPSCYMYYLNFGIYAIAGSSPECLVKTTAYSDEDKRVTLNPIAGTRRRGRSVEEDQALEAELVADPKETAEHLMLVDLGRNDLGRIAKAGTVQVSVYKRIKKYPQVMHMLSTLHAQIEGNMKPIELIKSTFPAGTLSGAPKVRAMHIIDEFEVARRGAYGGGVGYIGFDGRIDLAICIRTAIVRHDRNMLYLGVGAGIVADSQPKLEWLECVNKARSIVAPLVRVQEKLN